MTRWNASQKRLRCAEYPRRSWPGAGNVPEHHQFELSAVCRGTEGIAWPPDGPLSRYSTALPLNEAQSAIVRINAYPEASADRAGIPHIKLPGPKRRAILDERHSSFTHGCRQPSNQARELRRERYRADAAGLGAAEPYVALMERHAVQLRVGYLDLREDIAALSVDLVDLPHVGVGQRRVSRSQSWAAKCGPPRSESR